LKIAGRVAFFPISSDYQPRPPKLQHIRFFQLNRLMSENRVNDYPSSNRALGTKPVHFGRVET